MHYSTTALLSLRSESWAILVEHGCNPCYRFYCTDNGAGACLGPVHKHILSDSVSDTALCLQDKHCFLDLSVENFVVVNQQRAAERLAYPRFLWIDDIVPEPDRDAGLGVALALCWVYMQRCLLCFLPCPSCCEVCCKATTSRQASMHACMHACIQAGRLLSTSGGG